MTTASSIEIEQLVRGEHSDPFHVLGPHPAGEGQVAVRTLQPGALEVWVLLEGGEALPMERLHPEGFFEVLLEGAGLPLRYRLRVLWEGGQEETLEDPYRFPPFLGEWDLYLFNEGHHQRIYERLGAHPMLLEGVAGVGFAIWAPNALRVSVVGDFNRWDGRRHPMRVRGASGVWELFIPGLQEGTLYKFEIRSHLSPTPFLRTDPYALHFEVRPGKAARVWSLGGYTWNDAAWLRERERRNWLREPIAIYEVHLGSWRRAEEGNRWLTYRELAEHLIPYVREMGFTHIELLPVMEHPLDESWGYQALGYYAPTSRYGTPQEFMAFVDACHREGIGVILDWVPAHFPADPEGLAEFDGTCLYEHADPRLGHHPDWGTRIFNYGRREVFNFLEANALFWLREYHADGLRIDAVASMLYLDYSRGPGQWVPNRYGGRENLEAIAFLRHLNEETHGQFPGTLTVAEESTAWPMVSRPVYLGGLGFTLKWNMGWMNDVLRYMARDPIHRKWHHDELTFSFLYAFAENFVLPLSHDEVVHGKGSLLGKMPGDPWQKFANLRLLLAYQYSHPGKKLLFMGSEFGQWREWDVRGSLDWHLLQEPAHAGVQRMVKDLNHLYRRERALHGDCEPQGFRWVDGSNWQESVLLFLRQAPDTEEFLLIACNFTPVPRFRYRAGVPQGGFYREIFNSDSAYYGGSNLGNGGGVWARSEPAHGFPWSVELTLPPLAVVWLKPS